MKKLFLFLVFVQGMALLSPSYGRDGEVGGYNLWSSAQLLLEFPGRGVPVARRDLEAPSPGGVRWGAIALGPIEQEERAEQEERTARERAELEAKELRAQLEEMRTGQEKAEAEKEDLRTRMMAALFARVEVENEVNDERIARKKAEDERSEVRTQCEKALAAQKEAEDEMIRLRAQLEERCAGQEKAERDSKAYKTRLNKAEADVKRLVIRCKREKSIADGRKGNLIAQKQYYLCLVAQKERERNTAGREVFSLREQLASLRREKNAAEAQQWGIRRRAVAAETDAKRRQDSHRDIARPRGTTVPASRAVWSGVVGGAGASSGWGGGSTGLSAVPFAQQASGNNDPGWTTVQYTKRNRRAKNASGEPGER